jgi:hypothetical protein
MVYAIVTGSLGVTLFGADPGMPLARFSGTSRTRQRVANNAG